MLNKTDIAAPLGVSVPTITTWLNVLEITGQIILIPPFYENFGRRLVKSPKLYFTDPGLVCHLLGIERLSELRKSPFHGVLFEGFVATEIIKQQINNGKRRELYYFRDQQGLEIDFVIPSGAGKLLLLEVKATKTPKPAMAKPLNQLATTIKSYKTTQILVHNSAETTVAGSTILPGVSALTLSSVLDKINKK